MLNGCAYILTVDVGNTFIRFGLFAEDSAAAQECPLATCEITTPSSITADEARMRLVQVMAALAADAGMPGALVPAAAVLSCVVPALELPWKAALSRTCTGRVLTVGPGLKTGMPVHYDDPAEIGPDRIADAVAARAVYGSPVHCDRPGHHDQYRGHRRARYLCRRCHRAGSGTWRPLAFGRCGAPAAGRALGSHACDWPQHARGDALGRGLGRGCPHRRHARHVLAEMRATKAAGEGRCAHRHYRRRCRGAWRPLSAIA